MIQNFKTTPTSNFHSPPAIPILCATVWRTPLHRILPPHFPPRGKNTRSPRNANFPPRAAQRPPCPQVCQPTQKPAGTSPRSQRRQWAPTFRRQRISRTTNSQQPLVPRNLRRLAPCIHVEFGQNIPHVTLNRVNADDQLVRDLLIRRAARRDRQRLQFALG